MKKVLKHPRWGDVIVTRTRRARRISLSVRPPAQVRLSIPILFPMKEGVKFLDDKENWIADTIEKLAKKHPVRIIEPSYTTTHRSLEFRPDKVEKIYARVSKDIIVVTFPEEMTYSAPEVQEVTRLAIIEALKREAKQILPVMVEELAQTHGFRYGKVSVRATKSRWGSCSGKNDISLCVFLLRLPQHLIEYIILHELCHTIHKNHSPKFHALLDSILDGRERELSRELLKYRTDVL